MATTNGLRNGLAMKIDNQPWQVIELQHVKLGKGPAFVRTKIKNVLSGKIVDRTFNAGLKIETATVDRRDMTYSYNDGTGYVFMDGKTFEMVPVSPDIVGDAAHFLLENQKVILVSHEDKVLFVELLVSVVLEITHTGPGLQGDRFNAGTKPATVETGYEIQVSLFLNIGDKVKVDARSEDCISRVTN